MLTLTAKLTSVFVQNVMADVGTNPHILRVSLQKHMVHQLDGTDLVFSKWDIYCRRTTFSYTFKGTWCCSQWLKFLLIQTLL